MDCKFCINEVSENPSGRKFYFPLHSGSHPMATTLDGMDVCLAEDDSGFYLHYEDDYGDVMIDIRCDYCPKCGRDLR